MDLYIPYGWTPYDGESHYGVFSTRENAQNVLEKEKGERYHDNYEIMVVQLDERGVFLIGDLHAPLRKTFPLS